MQKWTQKIKDYFLSAYNWRLAIAFFSGLVISALLMDFDIFASHIKTHILTQEFGNLLALLTGKSIELLGYSITIVNNAIRFSHDNGVYFTFGCLGYREIIWFTIFLLIVPGPIKHKLWYIPLGIIVIEISNVLRAVSIAISNFHAPKSFELIHAQGTVWFVYGTVLALWLFWLNFFRE